MTEQDNRQTQEIEETPTTRRGLAAMVLGVLTLGAFGAKPARAQLSDLFGGGAGAAQLASILAVLEVIRDFTMDIFGELERAFEVLGIRIPWWIWDWLREIFGSQGAHAGEASTVRQERVMGAAERSYPVDPGRYVTPNDRAALAQMRAEDVRLRVEESMIMLAAIAESQAAMANADEVILNEVEDAESLVQIGKASVAMQAVTNSLLRQIIVQNTHIGQLLFDPAMAHSAGMQAQLVMQEELGIRRDGPSPVGRIPGVP